MEKLSEYVDLELNLKMATETECIISDQSDHNINELLEQKPQLNLYANSNTNSNNTTPQPPSMSLSPSPLSSPSWQQSSSSSWQQASPSSCQQPSSNLPLSLTTVLDNNISSSICINDTSEYCNRVEGELLIQDVPSDGGIFGVLVSHCVSPLKFTVSIFITIDYRGTSLSLYKGLVGISEIVHNNYGSFLITEVV